MHFCFTCIGPCLPDANQFKVAFESAQSANAGISGDAPSATAEPAAEEPKDETTAPTEPEVTSKVEDVSLTSAEVSATTGAPITEEKKEAEEEKKEA